MNTSIRHDYTSDRKAPSMADNTDFLISGDFEGFSSGSDSSDAVPHEKKTKSKAKKRRAYRFVLLKKNIAYNIDNTFAIYVILRKIFLANLRSTGAVTCGSVRLAMTTSPYTSI